MPVNLEGITVDSDEGRWTIEYIGQPREEPDGDRVDYHLRCKWVDPNNAGNRATPERRLRLRTYASQEAYADHEDRLRATVSRWMDGGCEEDEGVFDRDHAYLLKPQARDQP